MEIAAWNTSRRASRQSNSTVSHPLSREVTSKDSCTTFFLGPVQHWDNELRLVTSVIDEMPCRPALVTSLRPDFLYLVTISTVQIDVVLIISSMSSTPTYRLIELPSQHTNRMVTVRG